MKAKMEFQCLSQEKLNDALSQILCPKIVTILNSRSPGHCMRLSNLDIAVMENICRELYRVFPNGNFFILGNNSDANLPYQITSTKLVEYRNPNADGSLREPLLVFIPVSLRTSAEDSFGVATFESLSFNNIYEELTASLLNKIPAQLAASVKSILGFLKEQKWQFIDDLSTVKYLLTAIENGDDGETFGASLYEVGLIPDFHLFDDTSLIISRIQRNYNCMFEKLLFSHDSLRGKIASLKLVDKDLETLLFVFFSKHDVQDIEMWTKIIVSSNAWHAISFDKWKFQDEISSIKIDIRIVSLDLPFVGDNEQDKKLVSLIGHQVLVPRERKSFNVKFKVEPHPKTVISLGYFTIQIITQNGEPMGKIRKIKPWTVNKLETDAIITNLQKIEFEEGWHFVRILPWTASGDIIPISNDDSSDSHPYESMPFYVLPEGSLEEEPPQRAFPVEKSLEHAHFNKQFSALLENREPGDIKITSIEWVQSGNSKKTIHETPLLVHFGRDGAVQIPVSNMLRDIEQKILRNPKHLTGWKMQINQSRPEMPIELNNGIMSSSEIKAFIDSRQIIFNKLINDNKIIQGFSFSEEYQIENDILDYAEKYRDLILFILRQAEKATGQDLQNYLKTLKTILNIDSIHIIFTDYKGVVSEAILLAPTHPLQLTWLYCWKNLGMEWLEKSRQSDNSVVSGIKTSFLENFLPSAFPIALLNDNGRFFPFVDNINPFWSLYAPSGSGKSPRVLFAEICSIFGFSSPSEAGSDISGELIAAKIERYLTQHPYIRELCLNVFNPGAGTIIADALLALQRKREYSNLRYNIRLFSEDPDDPILGESLEQLLYPETNTGEAADAFSTIRGNHLYSKLKLAKHNNEDFERYRNNYSSHISILLDVFQAERTSILEKGDSKLTINGLIQDYDTEFKDDNNETFWKKSPVIGEGFATNTIYEERHLCYALLASINKYYCYALSAISSSGAKFKSVPSTILSLTVMQRSLIYNVHQNSDWVFIIDKNIGIEYFDHGGMKNRPEYLIDYTPGLSSLGTHNFIISSKSSDEIRAMLNPVLSDHGILVGSGQSIHIITALRSLSGQLALKLISAPTQQMEALGLALARLYLEYQGALSNQIIVPLDAHIDLYQQERKEQASAEDINLHRTDLALFDLNFLERIITCSLVEVKCYSATGGVSLITNLKEKINAQITQSEKILQYHFDPSFKTPDRPDRVLKCRQLEKILNFYLDRSIRYLLFDKEAKGEAYSFLGTLEENYQLKFKHSAIIFDFAKDGTEAPENDFGIEFHRIGRDLIQLLLDNCQTNEPSELEVSKSSSLCEILIPNIPKHRTASFIAPKRDRTLTKETPSVDIENDISISDEHSNDERQEERIKDFDNKSNFRGLQDQKEPGASELNNKFTNGAERKNTTIQSEEAISGLAKYDVMLGTIDDSPQYGLLGEISGRNIALDLNHTHTISLFGIQGGGKSYTLGTVVEMAAMPIKNINTLPNPLATVIFHYSSTQDYAPEFTTMIKANSVENEIKLLKERYHAEPKALKDILILTPENQVEARQRDFPDIEIKPLAFSPSELKVAHWKFLMGAVGNQSMYIHQINLIMRSLRNKLTLSALRNGIDNSSLSDTQKDLAHTRLDFAAEYIKDNQKLQEMIRPGRLIIVDLRDEFIAKDEALGLFVVMLQIFSEAIYEGKSFNKLIVLDEAHKYIENGDLIGGLVEVVREMRHKGTSIMVASQDPPSVPIALIELSTQIIMHKFNSPAWLKHLQKANTALGGLNSDKMSRLGTGEAYIWSSKASDDSFTQGAVKIKCRPRATQHGGGTKTAVLKN